jgi:glutamine transport system ATP-binding protein
LCLTIYGQVVVKKLNTKIKTSGATIMISARNIHKSFEGRKILDGIDMDIEPGKITCLIGPSGSGKTTLLRALGLLEYPEQGDILIDAKKYHFPLPKDKPEIKKGPWPKVTVVFQSLFLWPHMTLRENIALPALNKKRSINNLDKKIDKLVAAFDMASLGQRQRVALARALILEPQYVLLDEITSSLDVEQIEKILNYLQMLRAEGMGVFLITHLLGFARRAADKIVFVDGGKIQEQGGPEILENPQSPRLKQFLATVEAAS